MVSPERCRAVSTPPDQRRRPDEKATLMDTDFTPHPDADLAWQDIAACKNMSHVFFGPQAERPERRVEREALALTYCLSCPAIMACRKSARLNREHGFWGGENDEQRAAAGYAPRSPSRRSVIEARDRAKQVPEHSLDADYSLEIDYSLQAGRSLGAEHSLESANSG